MPKHVFTIRGLDGMRTLSGTVAIKGAKNAALKSLAAALLFKDHLNLSNVPESEDIKRTVDLLVALGASVHKRDSDVGYLVEVPEDMSVEFPREIANRLRASVVLTGPMLARFGRVTFPHPGGCVIGARPIDLFLEGYRAMGARVVEHDDRYEIVAEGGMLKGATIFFRNQSVGATETLMMAAIFAKGTTVLKNAALEPEIKALADFLNHCGAKISGVGTPTITIIGTELLICGDKKLVTIPDRLEAGSFLILGALAAKELKITHCNPEHVEALVEHLKHAGANIDVGKDFLVVRALQGTNSATASAGQRKKAYRAVDIKTHEYPGFPTDLQAPMTVFLTQADGRSLVFETIFEGRLNYIEELKRMGANIIMSDPHRIIVEGPTLLRGRQLESPDIRAGLAFVIAAIIAKGESVVHNVYNIDRGYEKIDERLRAIGVDITRELENRPVPQ